MTKKQTSGTAGQRSFVSHASPQMIEAAMLNTIMIRAKNPYSHTANAILQTLEQSLGYRFASKPEKPASSGGGFVRQSG